MFALLTPFPTAFNVTLTIVGIKKIMIQAIKAFDIFFLYFFSSFKSDVTDLRIIILILVINSIGANIFYCVIYDFIFLFFIFFWREIF